MSFLYVMSYPLIICSFVLYIIYLLYCHACAHHVVVERRPAVFSHENWLNEQAHFVAVLAECHGSLEPLVVGHRGHDDSHVNVAPRVGVSLAVGAEHHNLSLAVKARHDYLLVSSDKAEGLITAEHSWSIHCCICLVCSTICRVLSSPSVLAMLRL